MNTDKRSASLDMKTGAGHAEFEGLVDRSSHALLIHLN